MSNPTHPKTLTGCEQCNGICPNDPPYKIPVTRTFNGQEYHGYALCKYGLEREFARQCRKVQIPSRYIGKSFSDYAITADNERAVKLAQGLIAGKLSQGLYLYGAVGTGKTYLASLIAQQSVRNAQSVIFGDVPTLLDKIKRTFDTGGTDELIKRYCTCDLLVLDDLGAGQMTDWNIGVLYRVINARYNADKRLIVTSNHDFNDLRNRLTVKDKNGNIIDAFTGKRIVSRLSEMCIQAFLGTVDRRK